MKKAHKNDEAILRRKLSSPNQMEHVISVKKYGKWF